MTIWRMSTACWTPNAKNIQPNYVTFIDFPLQQWLQERASMIRHSTLPGSGVPTGVCGVQPPPPPNSEVLTKLRRISSSVEKYIRNYLTRIRVSLIYKLSGTPDKGATTPTSPFSLPSVLN
jgi:hypothetical protein